MQADNQLHLMQLTRKEIYNAVCKLSCHLTVTSQVNYKVMLSTVSCAWTRNQGLFLTSTRKWVRKEKTFNVSIYDWSVSDYAKNQEN